MTAAGAGAFSWNLDCNIPCKLPTGAVLQIGTVETTATAEDYLVGVGRAIVAGVIDSVIFVATGGFDLGFDPKKEEDVVAQVVRNGIGRLIPFPPIDPDHTVRSVAAWGNFIKTEYGISPQGDIAVLLDAFHIPVTGAGNDGAKWTDVLGPPIGVLPDPGDPPTSPATTIIGIQQKILDALFPPLALQDDLED